MLLCITVKEDDRQGAIIIGSVSADGSEKGGSDTR